MKVGELAEKLGKLDPELEVLGYTEDSDLLPPGHLFRLLHINDVSEGEGERRRGEDGIPSLKIGRTDLSEKLAFLDVSADF